MNKYEVASTRYQKIIDFLEHEISLKGDLILNVDWTDSLSQETARWREKFCSKPVG